MIQKLLGLLVLLLALVRFSSCQAQNPAAEQFLMGATLNGYNRNIRPSSTVYVSLRMFLRDFDLNEESSTMTSSFQLMQLWYEYRIRWNSSLYDNVTHLMMPARNIWLPDTFIQNTVDSVGYLPLYDSSIAVITNIGAVYYAVPLLNVKTRCDMDFFYYPFDSQNCTIIFTSWVQSTTRIYYLISSSTIFMNTFRQNANWDISAYTVSTVNIEPKFPPDPYAFSTLRIEFKFQRKLNYRLFLHLVVPCLILNLATIVSYMMPFIGQITLSKIFNLIKL